MTYTLELHVLFVDSDDVLSNVILGSTFKVAVLALVLLAFVSVSMPLESLGFVEAFATCLADKDRRSFWHVMLPSMPHQLDSSHEDTFVT